MLSITYSYLASRKLFFFCLRRPMYKQLPGKTLKYRKQKRTEQGRRSAFYKSLPVLRIISSTL